jgi:hypothetical protein
MNETERLIANHIDLYALDTIQKLKEKKGEWIRAASRTEQEYDYFKYAICKEHIANIQESIAVIEWMVSPENKSFCKLVAKIASELV